MVDLLILLLFVGSGAAAGWLGIHLLPEQLVNPNTDAEQLRLILTAAGGAARGLRVRPRAEEAGAGAADAADEAAISRPSQGHLEPSWGLPGGMWPSLWHTKMPIKHMHNQQSADPCLHGV